MARGFNQKKDTLKKDMEGIWLVLKRDLDDDSYLIQNVRYAKGEIAPITGKESLGEQFARSITNRLSGIPNASVWVKCNTIIEEGMFYIGNLSEHPAMSSKNMRFPVFQVLTKCTKVLYIHKAFI